MNKVEKYLIDKGYEPILNGFDYTVFAVELIREDRKYKENLCNLLYPTIAEKFKTSASKVERAIRHFKQKHFKMNNGNFIAFVEIETRN